MKAGVPAIAFDLDPEHLASIVNATPRELRKLLTVVRGSFPEDLAFPPDSLGAVLISQVLGFVSGPNIRLGFERLYEAMAPGAKLFVINYTPFISITEAFLPEYEARKHRGVEWPGHVDRLQDYCKKAALLEHLPDSLNLMDIDVLRREFGTRH